MADIVLWTAILAGVLASCIEIASFQLMTIDIYTKRPEWTTIFFRGLFHLLLSIGSFSIMAGVILLLLRGAHVRIEFYWGISIGSAICFIWRLSKSFLHRKTLD